MNDLMNVLLQRQMGPTGGPMAPQAQPPPEQPQTQAPVIPPNAPAKIPPEAKRFANTQQIEAAYRGNWSPNPVILRALLGHR